MPPERSDDNYDVNEKMSKEKTQTPIDSHLSNRTTTVNNIRMKTDG